MIIRYTKVRFVRPEKMSNGEYDFLMRTLDTFYQKKKLSKWRSFYNHFKTTIIIFVVSLIVAVICAESKQEPWETIGGISVIPIVGTSLILFLEGRSFIEFINNHNRFYKKMETYLKKTNSYEEFVDQFYDY